MLKVIVAGAAEVLSGKTAALAQDCCLPVRFIGFLWIPLFFSPACKILRNPSSVPSTLTAHAELVLSTDLLKAHAVPSYKSSVKMLNSIDLSTDP